MSKIGEYFALQLGKETLNSSVLFEALRRAGNNKNLHGHVHEILVRNFYNANPTNFMRGRSARLVKSPNAKTVDIVLMKGRRVIGRLQIKDCLSRTGVMDLAKRSKLGQYRSAKLVVSKEMLIKSKSLGVFFGRKSIESSGISGYQTRAMVARVASRFPTKAILARVAIGGAVIDASIGGGFAIYSATKDYRAGTKTIKEAGLHVVQELAGHGISGAAGGASAILAGAGASVLAGPIVGLATSFVASVGVAVGMKKLWDKGAVFLKSRLKARTLESQEKSNNEYQIQAVDIQKPALSVIEIENLNRPIDTALVDAQKGETFDGEEARQMALERLKAQSIRDCTALHIPSTKT